MTLKTRSVCLICLRRFGGGGGSWEGEGAAGCHGAYQTRMLVPYTGLGQQCEAGSQGGDEGRRHSLDLYSRFLLLTGRYLKISASERLLEFAREHKNSTGESVQAFCDECQVLVGYICDLYAELQVVKLNLLRKVGELEKVTRLSTRKVSLKLARGLTKSVAEQLNIKSVRQLELYRKTLMLNCNRKTKGSTPQVLVPRGLFPEHWKFTFSATKLSLMRLIVIFALASPPRKRVEKKEPGGIMRKPGPLKRRLDDRRKVAFEDIAHHFMGVTVRRKCSTTGEDGVAVKREEGAAEGQGNEENSDADDNDGGFPDTGADDNDSDWSRGAASPTGSLDSAGSDVNFNSETDENAIPTKRRRLRRTRQRLASGSANDEPGDSEDDNNDPDFMAAPSRKKGPKRPPPLSLKDATIPCKHCKKLFVDRRGLAKHLRDIHNTHLDWICDTCGFKSKTATEFLDHKRRFHPGVNTSGTKKAGITSDKANLPCPKCKRKFIDARGLSRHMLGSHNSRLEYTCNMCGHKSKTAADHMAHRSKMHKKSRTTLGVRRQKGQPRLRRGLETDCRLCEKQFPSRKEYLRHNKEVHNWNDYRFECPVCMKQVVNDQRFKRHLIMHEKDSGVLRAFHCEVCGKTYYTENALSDHFVTVHEGSYSCTLCEAKYPSSSLLRSHLETHETDQKNFFCNFCFRGYTNEQYWQIHQKVAHVGNERIFCDQDRCAEEFGNVKDLNEHLKVHIEELRAKDAAEKAQKQSNGEEVEENPKDSSSSQNNNGDDKTNDGVDKGNDEDKTADDPHQIYTCGTCGWGFLKKYSLVLHALVHIPYDKEFGYKCPKEGCDKTLRLKDKLISHYNHLHGEKYRPYECHECGHKFSHFIWFKTHLRLHEERKSGRKFICEICNAECLDSIALAAHKRTHGLPKRDKSVVIDSGEETRPKRRGPGRPRLKPKTAAQLQKEKEDAEKINNVPCEICQTICESSHLLKKHLEKEHEQIPLEEKTIQCNFCDLKFVHEQTHRLHEISIHMQKNKYVCDAERCDEHFENHLTLNEHLKKVHLESTEDDIQGQTTEVTTGCTDDVGKSENKLNPEESASTDQTEAAAPQPVKVKQLVYCRICNWGFVNPDFLELHELVHTSLAVKQPPAYPCPGCDSTFASTTKLISHFNNVHGKKLRPYKCFECPATFFKKAGLRFHIARHERRRHLKSDEKFVCIDCGRSFLDLYSLNYHRKDHDPANHVLCPEGCGLKFVNKIKLNIHMKKVHGKGEKFPCPQCGIAFIYEYELKTHINWVHGPPKFQCEVCEKQYRRPSGLRRHRRTHDPDASMGDTMYICSECGKSYKSEEGLKFHTQSIHTPDHLKKFSCTHCTYKTHRRILLKMHMMVCLRNKGVPYDEAKWGKVPVVKKYTGPPRKRGRRAWKKKEETDEEEEMEEKSTTEDEDEVEEEEEKPSTSETPPQQPLYPHLQPQSAPTSSSANVINAIIANLTGLPDLAVMNEPEETTTRRGRRGSGRRQSKEPPTLHSTIDHTLFQSMASQQQHHPLPPQHPQLFGNSHPGQYQNWLSSTSAGPSTVSNFSHQYQQQSHHNSNEVKQNYSNSNTPTPPPPHLQPQHQHDMVYSPNHVYSPPLPDLQPQNLHYTARK